MRRKILSPSKFFPNLIRISIFILMVVFLSTGCSNETPNSPSEVGMVNWVDLNIKFKPGTNSMIRNMAISSIQDVLMDSIKQMRQIELYHNYQPSFSANQNPFKDSTYFSLTVGVIYPLKDSVCKCQCACPPPCLCINNCGVCEKILNTPVHSGFPTVPGDEIPLVGMVDSVKLNGSLIYPK